MLDKIAIGDRIGGFYEVREIFGGEGKSGMGEVFICYYRWHQKLYALKTYQDRFFNSDALRNAFYKEALIWSSLESHPNIVQAHWVHNLDGKIYVVMEYVPPDNAGRVSLSHHLTEKKPLPFFRMLIWAIQFCYGMEYACSRGVKVHRDIKPDNILIALDKTLRITDFGLAKAFDAEDMFEGRQAGTPYWMSPEQFENAGICTVRSDIYSFGVVLYQMASGQLPFKEIPSRGEHFFQMMHHLHAKSPIIRLDNDLFPIIEQCMAKKPEDRWSDFADLRNALEGLWKRKTDIPLPKPLQVKQLGAKEINQKGVAMKHLGKFNEALSFHNQAIEMDPTFPNAWNDKGIALWELDRTEEAMECFNKAIDLDPEFVHPRNNKANLILQHPKLTSYEPYDDTVLLLIARGANAAQREALQCYEDALKIDPNFINLWIGKGSLHFELGKTINSYMCSNYEQAVKCYDKALYINKRSVWVQYRKEQAIESLQALKVQCRQGKCSSWDACNPQSSCP